MMQFDDEDIINAQDFIEGAEQAQGVQRYRRALMMNAAHRFRLAQDWESVTDSDLESVEIKKESDDNETKAAGMMMNCDNILAIKTLELMGEDFFRQDQLFKAANVKQQIAEIYESENAYLLAAKNYEEAFELYKMQEMITPYDRFDLLLKAAELNFIAAPNKRHIMEAIHTYESVASKYSQVHIDAKEFYFKVITLHLAKNDIAEAAEALRNFGSSDPKFKESPTYCSTGNIIKDFQERSFSKFRWRYQKAGIKTMFELWDTTILKLVKAHLEKSSRCFPRSQNSRWYHPNIRY